MVPSAKVRSDLRGCSWDKPEPRAPAVPYLPHFMLIGQCCLFIP